MEIHYAKLISHTAGLLNCYLHIRSNKKNVNTYYYFISATIVFLLQAALFGYAPSFSVEFSNLRYWWMIVPWVARCFFVLQLTVVLSLMFYQSGKAFVLSKIRSNHSLLRCMLANLCDIFLLFLYGETWLPIQYGMVLGIIEMLQKFTNQRLSELEFSMGLSRPITVDIFTFLRIIPRWDWQTRTRAISTILIFFDNPRQVPLLHAVLRSGALFCLQSVTAQIHDIVRFGFQQADEAISIVLDYSSNKDMEIFMKGYKFHQMDRNNRFPLVKTQIEKRYQLIKTVNVHIHTKMLASIHKIFQLDGTYGIIYDYIHTPS